MGSADSKLNFRKAVIQLTTKTQVRARHVGRGGEVTVVVGAAMSGGG